MAIKTGDRLAFNLHDDGSLHVSPVRSERRALKGLLADYAKAGVVDEDRVREALRERAKAKYATR